MNRGKLAKQTAYTAAVCTLLVLLAGCRLDVTGTAPTDNYTEAAEQSGASLAGNDSDSPQKAYAANEGEPEAVLMENAPSDSTAIDAKTESTSKQAGTKPTTANDELTWDAKAPKLHGIAIGDAKTNLDNTLGKHVDSYSIGDGAESITVMEYSGFSVGYGADKKVKFVEVFDKSVPTGLNGLRVGDSESTVTDSLGKPKTHTASVLAYQTNDSLLKLDLDPQNKRVLSIKLFLH